MKSIVEDRTYLKDPVLRGFLEKVCAGDERVRVSGPDGSAKALLTALVRRFSGKTTLVVVPTLAKAERFCRDLSVFLRDGSVRLYPPWDLLSQDFISSRGDVEAARVDVLSHLLLGKPLLVVAPVDALMQKVRAGGAVRSYMQTVAIGDFLDREEFMKKLDEGGYRHVSLVEEKGEYSVRGHVVDVFPPSETRPLRLIFVGDEVESIKTFDVDSQRTAEERVDFVLSPARELVVSEELRKVALRELKDRANEINLPRLMRDRLQDMVANGLSLNPRLLPLFGGSGDEGCVGLFSFLPAGSVVILNDPYSLERAGNEYVETLDKAAAKAREEGRFYLEHESYLFSGEELRRGLEAFQEITFDDLEVERREGGVQPVRLDVTKPSGFREEGVSFKKSERPLQPLMEKLRAWREEGNLVNLLCSGEAEMQKMARLLEDYGLEARRANGDVIGALLKHNGRGELVLSEGRLSGGFIFPCLRLVVLSDEEIFGPKVSRRKRRPVHEGYFLRSFGELKEGDFVVHTDHGIGIYRGLEKLAVGDIENDFLNLEYSEGDKLYIPVDRLDRIQRYIGPDGHAPKVDKLGGTSWENAKKRVKRSVEEVAEELVSLYAARETLERRPFAPTDAYYDEFCSSFEFEETPDQARAIEDVNVDMADSKPMDRLVCGDAGFGKTEVAIRAAFRAVMEGKQAAVLVPTTILAEQHYQTFSRRLEKYPIRIDVLNRFKARNEQQKVIDDLGRGKIDIVIGTHRLLQKDVFFKELGLVVVDEEQRFGVSHKEKLKHLRTLVDVLTLTATPIPRTLQLSLVGIRDLSIINTPPEDRRSIKTHVVEFDEEVIKNAVRSELERKGQVFFVHDRINSIYTMERLVRRLVPEARVAVAHGRMKSRELEDVMVGYVRRDYDILVCTTIVGSGIDIPSANTIIINRADRFGLSQLYQLRGRVGRSKEEAYAYLLIPGGAMLAPDTQKRLRVIRELTEPGSGFAVASHDLEIRGAGNILGTSQSGHVAAVGYEMYIQLIENAIRDLKGEAAPEEEVRPEIHLGLPAFIGDDYMPDVNRRLVMYKRISMASTEEDISALRDELLDCYGYIPVQVENLLEVIRIRNLAKPLAVKRVDYDDKTLSLSFMRSSSLNPEKIFNLIRKKARGVKFTPDHRLIIPIPGLGHGEVISAAKGLLSELAG